MNASEARFRCEESRKLVDGRYVSGLINYIHSGIGESVDGGCYFFTLEIKEYRECFCEVITHFENLGYKIKAPTSTNRALTVSW